MLPFSQSISPALKDYMNAQYALLSDMSERAMQGVQRINELNIQIAQSAMEDSLKGVQQVMTAHDPYEALSIAASQAQPAADKLRDYQQGLTEIAANTQVELSRAAETHVPNASRSAAAVADEVARTAKDQTEQAVARQKAAVEKATEKATSSGKGQQQQTASAQQSSSQPAQSPRGGT